MKRGIGAVIWGSALCCVPSSAWAGFSATWVATPSVPAFQQGSLARGEAAAALSDWRATWESQTRALRREAGVCASGSPAAAAPPPPGCWTYVARHAQAMSALWAGRPALAVVVRYFEDVGRLAGKCQAEGSAACLESSDALRVRMDKRSVRILLGRADQ